MHRDLREYGWSLTIGRLLDEGDPAVLGAIKNQPEFARAVELTRALEAARQVPADHPTMTDWFIARLTDDSARDDRLAARLFDHESKVWAELHHLLGPSNASETYVAFTERHTPKALAKP